jgi:hypothetical protein
MDLFPCECVDIPEIKFLGFLTKKRRRRRRRRRIYFLFAGV